MRKILLLLLGLLPALCVAEKVAQQRVETWSYNLSPPFSLQGQQGLSAAFVELLNNEPANNRRFRFELVELPRKRLDLRLADNRPGVLLWVAPRFLSHAQTAQGRWSRPLLDDQQVVISSNRQPIDYEGPESLHGLAFGGLLGHLYAGLDADVASGRIRREDVTSDLQNLEKVSSGRVDAALVPRSTLLYYRKAKRFDGLYVAPTPLYSFRRHLLMTSSLSGPATEYVLRVVETLPHSPRWLALIERYGLESLGVYRRHGRANGP